MLNLRWNFRYPGETVLKPKLWHKHPLTPMMWSVLTELWKWFNNWSTVGWKLDTEPYATPDSCLFGCQIKPSPGTGRAILSHHKFLMGSTDDSRQSNICSAFPLSRGAPVDLHLTSVAGERDHGFLFQAGGQKRPRRGSFMSTVYLGGGEPLFLSFFSPP